MPIIIQTIPPFGIDGNLKIMDACCTCNHQLLIICSNKKYPPFDINFKEESIEQIPLSKSKSYWNNI